MAARVTHGWGRNNGKGPIPNCSVTCVRQATLANALTLSIEHAWISRGAGRLMLARESAMLRGFPVYLTPILEGTTTEALLRDLSRLNMMPTPAGSHDGVVGCAIIADPSAATRQNAGDRPR